MAIITNCSKEDFFEKVNKNGAIAFCAGNEFKRICDTYNIANNIKCVIDNYKFRTTVCLNDCNIPVVSIDSIDPKNEDALFFISSIMYSVEIIEQLDKLEGWKDIQIFIPTMLIDENIDFISDGGNLCIPKVINYCWFGGKEVPDNFKKNIETWHKCCPDYDIVRWDESNYDVSKNKYMYEAYKAKKWGFVPDFARLDIIYNNGGIYFDTDVMILKSFDELLGYDMFCGFESDSFIALGLGFGARKGFYIIKEMLDMYDKLKFINDDGTLNMTPSPVFQSEIMKKNGFLLDGKVQKRDKVLVLSPSFLSPINFYGGGEIRKNSFSIHQYAASWFGDSERQNAEKVRKIYNYLEKRVEK